MATETHEAEATRELRRKAKRYVLRIKLVDGEEVRAEAGSDPEAARQQLASIHTAGTADAFVHLGADTIVRSSDIRYIRLTEVSDEDDDGPGVIDAIKARIGGGDEMTTYDTEQGARAARPRTDDAGGQARGFFDDPGIGYGRRPWAETKPFFLTSEFLTLVVIVVGLAIAMGALDNFNADRGWLLITVIGAAYIIARGLAKAGTRDPNPDRRDLGRDYR
jgi:hypothetical protein